MIGAIYVYDDPDVEQQGAAVETPRKPKVVKRRTIMGESNQNIPTVVQPGTNPTAPSNGNVIPVPAPVKLNSAAAQPIPSAQSVKVGK
jgi:hypothetical protein